MPRIRSQEGILSAEWLIENPHNAYSTEYQKPEMAERHLHWLQLDYCDMRKEAIIVLTPPQKFPDC